MLRGLTALAEVLNIDGSLKWKKGASLDSAEDSVTTIAQMEYPADLTSMHFVRLALFARGHTGFDQPLLTWRARRKLPCHSPVA